MTTCPRCGGEVGPDVAFCQICGLELHSASASKESPALFPEPVLKIDPASKPGTSVDAFVFYGRGVRVQSLPERIPDSMYAWNPDSRNAWKPPPQGADAARPANLGKYNRQGTVAPIASHVEAVQAVKELAGLIGRPSRISVLMSIVPHFGCCRIPGTRVTAFFPRGLDIHGSMTMTGYVAVSGAATEAQLRQSISDLGKLLEEEGLFGPLTPRDQLGGGGEDDPRAFDYFANHSDVWSDEG